MCPWQSMMREIKKKQNGFPGGEPFLYTWAGNVVFVGEFAPHPALRSHRPLLPLRGTSPVSGESVPSGEGLGLTVPAQIFWRG